MFNGDIFFTVDLIANSIQHLTDMKLVCGEKKSNIGMNIYKKN